MKILQSIPDGDYAALDFKREYTGTKVSDLIARVESGETKFPVKDFEVELKVHDFEDQSFSPRLRSFVRNEIEDYEQSKSWTFWFEDEVIKD